MNPETPSPWAALAGLPAGLHRGPAKRPGADRRCRHRRRRHHLLALPLPRQPPPAQSDARDLLEQAVVTLNALRVEPFTPEPQAPGQPQTLGETPNLKPQTQSMKPSRDVRDPQEMLETFFNEMLDPSKPEP